jgi:hypothetical protein
MASWPLFTSGTRTFLKPLRACPRFFGNGFSHRRWTWPTFLPWARSASAEAFTEP